jgi:hypothetical protein
MTTPIAPWPRPDFEATGRAAAVTLVAFATDPDLGADLTLAGTVPAGAPVDALDVRLHRYADSPDWIDNWRGEALRTLATQQLPDLTELDAATCCYSVTIEVDDPADLTHLQLAWAVAAALGRAGASTVLDVLAAHWLTGAAVAALAPGRPFQIQDEISLIAESESSPGFGHAIHTRGMAKLGRPDLIAGVPADRIEHTGRILNHLAGLLAAGHVLVPGQRLRVNGDQTLTVAPYLPDGTVPDVNLNNEAVLLLDS